MYLCAIPMYNIAIRYVQSMRYGFIVLKAIHFEKFGLLFLKLFNTGI